MLAQSKKRSKRNGIPFNITREDIIIPDVCPILGIPLFVGDGLAGPNSPSLDRIVPELGYTKGNVVVISYRANTIKSNATPQELEAIAAWLRRVLKPVH